MSGSKKQHPSEQMAKMSVRELVSVTFGQAVLFTGLGALLWYFSGRNLAEFVTVDAAQIGWGLALTAGMIGSGYVLFKGFPKLGERLIRDQAHSLAFLKNRLGPAPIIALSLCAGISEEALFRGGMLTLGSDYMPFWLALIISSGVFAAIHFAKILVAIFIFAIGIIFGLFYIALDSLLAVMIAHTLYDVWAIWYVQEEMHRLNVFEDNAIETPAETIAS